MSKEESKRVSGKMNLALSVTVQKFNVQTSLS